MPIYVLKPGVKQDDPTAVPDDTVWTGTCPTCGCVFDVTGRLLTRSAPENEITYSCQNRTCHTRVHLTYKRRLKWYEPYVGTAVAVLVALAAIALLLALA